MSEGPQYTNCTDKADWKDSFPDAVGGADIAGAVAAILAILAGILIPGAGVLLAAGVVLAFAATAEIIRKVAGWQLNTKLICLKNVQRRVFTDPDPDRICVLGTVLDFEKVGEDKSGFENIDNDFGVNLFIAPFPISDIAVFDPDPAKLELRMQALRRRMESSPQGDLIQNPDAQPLVGDPEPGPGPLMRKDDPTQPFGAMPALPAPPGFVGYKRGMMTSATYPTLIPVNVFFYPPSLVTIDPVFQAIYDDVLASYVAGHPGVDPRTDPSLTLAFLNKVNAQFDFTKRDAPAFHCEFEGSRIRDVYDALDFAHVECDTSGFWGFACDVLNFVISIFLGLPKLIAAAAAWANADDGNLSDAYDGAQGVIKLGDSLLVRGRWVYDSAHSGYNEVHAVRTVQKTQLAPQDPTEFLAFREEWCNQMGKVPPTPPPPRDPDNTPPDPDSNLPFTKPQRDTYDAQQRPENQWIYHPAIDGCVPPPPPDSDPLH
jgi:hypothetical protein